MIKGPNSSGVIAVDLDGTLAEYNGFKGSTVIGKPIPAMLLRVRQWLKDGRKVVIFTARVERKRNPYHSTKTGRTHEERRKVIKAIEDWCERYLGQKLPVTNEKSWTMTEFWDDRAIQVETNTGRPVTEKLGKMVMSAVYRKRGAGA